MDAFVYGKRRPLPQGFDEFVSVADTASSRSTCTKAIWRTRRIAPALLPALAKWSRGSIASTPRPAR